MNETKKFGVLDTKSKDKIREMEDMLREKYEASKGATTPGKNEKEIA